ncbi:choline BCCT transporter BetT [Kushneria sp. TE3]|uniref:choline BCCT transporter BetT n=1 Tax=Kushneria sp. TE3 TaxID=3449832 RepID=UPI003F685867
MADDANPPTVAKLNPPVFYTSAGIIVAFILFAVVAPELAGQAFGQAQGWVIDTFGWFYLLAMGVYLIFALYLAMSRHGRIRLGPDHSEPEYSYRSWFAMLFAAGMGIGIMYYGVAEPVTHYMSPPNGEGSNPAAAKEAMEITFFHWGLHPWGVYAVVALALAYFSFRHGLPLRLSSALYPLIGKRIHGPIGYAVDIFAVFGTMFGLATSLGLGVMQISSGLNFLFGFPDTLVSQIILIAAITAAATCSVSLGLDGGVKRLSEMNLWLVFALLLFVIVMGPTLFSFQSLAQNVGSYFSGVVDRTFNIYAYLGNEDTNDWLGNWTLFYWGWWIAWSPFVGMFVARVSRGRRIREFVMGVLFVPAGFNFIWMTFFGDGAIHMIATEGLSQLSDAVEESSSIALFEFLNLLPLSVVTSTIAVLLVATFFVTSADSGSLVMDLLTSKDGDESPVLQRIFWAVSAGVSAVALLMAGGLEALQAASLLAALPFSIILMVICYGLLKALRVEALKQDSLQHLMNTPGNVSRVAAGNTPGRTDYWQTRLQTLVTSPRRQQVSTFLHDTVEVAMKEVGEEFKKQSLDIRITDEDDRCYLHVDHGEENDFVYGVRIRRYAAPSFAMSGMRSKGSSKDNNDYRAEVFLREGGQKYNIMGYSKQQVIGDILDQYEKHLHFLHIMR